MTNTANHEALDNSASGAFASVTALFFAWGFTTSLIDPLMAAVKGIFAPSNIEAQLAAFAFFIAYGLVSIPAAILVARLKAVPSILLAIGLMVAAFAVIALASGLTNYQGVLLGLFIIASGITVLQLDVNPLAAALGRPEESHFRLTLSQAFNSLGTVLGPLLGAKLLPAVFTAVAGLLCIYVVVAGGVSAGYAALAIGLFNSIMFPVIFTLKLERSNASTEATSGFLCTAIIGGALVTLLSGAVADSAGYAISFVAPAFCYALLMIIALAAARAPTHAGGATVAVYH